MTVRGTANAAAAASRHIRSLGFRPLPSGMKPGTEGFRVENGGILSSARVTVDYVITRHAVVMAEMLWDAITAAGVYEIDRERGATTFYITRKTTA